MDPVSQADREEMAELVKLSDYIRRRALEVIEQGSAARKRQLREEVMAASLALKVALEKIERRAGP